MSQSKKRNRQRATFIGALIGLMIIFTFVISLINPGLGSKSDNNAPEPVQLDTPQPTAVIFPTPDSDPHLTGELPYIHNSGFFQTFRPAGSDWTFDEGPADEPYARVVIQSGQRLAVIHNYVQQGVNYDTVETLSQDHLNESYFATAWTDYTSWQETNRQFSQDTVTISFNLVAAGNDYLGEDITRIDGGWLYVTRLVVPANNPALLEILHNLVLPNFIGIHDLQTLPLLWPAWIDQGLGYALKHPPHWQHVAGDMGRPVTFKITSEDNALTIRVSTELERTLDSLEAAETWVTDAEPTATVLDSAPVERETGSGYQVAYNYTDSAGDAHSGLMVLLNDDAGTLFVTNLQFEQPDINALDAETVPPVNAQDVQALTQGFIVLPLTAIEPVTASPTATPEAE
jgi:hypothetical protein